MEDQYIKRLLSKYQAGSITDAEKAILDKWYLDVAADRSDEISEEERLDALNSAWVNIESRTIAANTKSIWLRIIAAASIVAVLSFGGWFILHRATDQQIQAKLQDVAPGGNKAILTLANGKTIVLTNAKNGQLAHQNNVVVNKSVDGAVTYQSTEKGTANNAALVYNTLTTPRGGKYDLTLADGTKVTLDAASSITYPVAFTGKERKVTITGQAYFEVVHNATQPFKVQVNNQTIEDIGTHFNINAYDDEPVITTTLLEGAVKLSTANASAMLKPSQQASISPNGVQYHIASADLASVMAWKNGLFSFDHTDLKTLLRQVSRWYDVDVVYNGPVGNYDFMGGIKRNTNLSNVLKILQQSGVHFKIEEKKLIVE